MGWNPVRLRKIHLGEVKNELGQYPRRRGRELEELATWLDIQDSVQQLWIESVPDLRECLAPNHDMLDGLGLGVAELTGCTDCRLVVREQLIAHVITCKKL